MKSVTILGSTGSIGTQALDVVRRNLIIINYVFHLLHTLLAAMIFCFVNELHSINIRALSLFIFLCFSLHSA